MKELTYKDLPRIEFPVFALPSDNLFVQDGLLFHNNAVVDDKNQIGENLGARRIQTPHQILKLRTCCEDISQLIDNRAPAYIDYSGYVFTYRKTKYQRVIYHRILSVIPKDFACILKLSKVNFPVIVKRPPPHGKEWVGMLYFNNKPWLAYEYSDYRCAPRRRMI